MKNFKKYNFNSDDDIENFIKNFNINYVSESKVLSNALYLSIPKNINEELIISGLYLQMGYDLIVNFKYLDFKNSRKFIDDLLGNVQADIVKLGSNIIFIKNNCQEN